MTNYGWSYPFAHECITGIHIIIIIIELSNGVYTYITHSVVSRSITWLINLLLTSIWKISYYLY